MDYPTSKNSSHVINTDDLMIEVNDVIDNIKVYGTKKQ